MSAGTAGQLYSPTLLSLATELASYPFVGAWEHSGSARSKTCGSSIEIGLELDDRSRIARLGLRVSACAVGQASAAIFAKGGQGFDRADLAGHLAEIGSWLNEPTGAEPTWPGFGPLLVARDYPGRHGALLLPWKAALQALSKGDASG
ncbi:iron-sulfur cluster assembly scaffold protein [Altererythrobacter sp. BO-6]|uniref:iron-sulfur cluster assembly scaffold protein n=1 Tax=Altererythrobacter sp. BO-6 TaxID=2604537 RepID=UPI0019D2FA73|nr:iron-sulfur cluster assembly scaffold protein [Altererythrobacter sp. BO-6]